MSTTAITIYADRRWPAKTGIGRVQASFEAAKPGCARIVDLGAAGSIGSPLSPLSLAWSILKLSPFKDRGSEARIVFSAGFIPPLFSRHPVVVVVHDLIHLRRYGVLKRMYYDVLLKPLYRRCHGIICVSEATRRELIAWAGIDPSRVHVIHNGVDPMFSPQGERWVSTHRYILYVGNHRSYKNLARLIRAYAGSSLPGRGIRLFLTGDRDSELIGIAEDLHVASSVRFLGAVGDLDLPRLYRGAVALAFVSLDEGFGLPIVEAMASDVPVVTSAVSAMPEIAGAAALLVDPLVVESIRDGLDRVVSDEALRSRLIRAGRDRAQFFRKLQSSVRYWELIEAVAEESLSDREERGCARA